LQPPFRNENAGYTVSHLQSAHGSLSLAALK
jgi:hypothetical protein